MAQPLGSAAQRVASNARAAVQRVLFRSLPNHAAGTPAPFKNQGAAWLVSLVPVSVWFVGAPVSPSRSERDLPDAHHAVELAESLENAVRNFGVHVDQRKCLTALLIAGEMNAADVYR